jgi:alkylhydroperoxidase family enzyme
MDIGSAVGRNVGITEEQLRGLADYRTSPAFNDMERLVIAYAEEMTKTPVDVPEALFSELRRRLDAAQIVELTAAIAWENYRARFNHALDIGSQGFSEGAFCVLPERG